MCLATYVDTFRSITSRILLVAFALLFQQSEILVKTGIVNGFRYLLITLSRSATHAQVRTCMLQQCILLCIFVELFAGMYSKCYESRSDII
jgi:hypothetical protein